MVMNKNGFIKGNEFTGEYSVKKWIVKKKETASKNYI
jgi:hypothetical protein